MTDRQEQVRTRRPRNENHMAWLVCTLLFLPPVGYAFGLLFRSSSEFSMVTDFAVGLVTMSVPVTVGWSLVYRSRGRRPVVLLTACAISCWALATIYFGTRAALGESVPLPSPADIGYVGFYLLLLAAIVRVIRGRVREMTWPVILDSVVGSLGTAAVLALVIGPIFGTTFDNLSTAGAALAVGYPLVNLLVVAAVIGIVATTGSVLGEGWAFLVLGLITFTGGHIAFVFMRLSGQYTVGTTLDAVWAFGLASVSAWLVLHDRGPRRRAGQRIEVPTQTIPALATVAGLAVLILASQQEVMLLAVVFAGLTLALAALPLVFRHRLRLSQANDQARTDELTGLLNRRALYTDVPSRLLADGRRRSAVLLLDLDKFKEVNDGLGHDVGDQLLIQVAARLAEQLRSTDLLARMGGDEFVIHLADCSPQEAEATAIKLRSALAGSFDLDGVTIHINASVGISWSPGQGSDLNLLLRRADMAMYAAKSTHSGYALYSDSNTEIAPHELLDVQSLNAALNEDQLILHFQPKVDLATGQVRGVEALVRWNHPVLAILQPDTFLKRFEETGLMPALTQVVLTQALDQAAVWAASGRPLSVAVNLSASSVMDSRLPEQIGEMTSARGLSPSVLVLEITEDVLIADRDRASTVLSALRAMGVRIAVDDFGKGYSSLSYLRELPIDELKLDKSFIFTMMDDARATALVVSTIDLAHSLGLEMTAEGVEDTQAYRALTDYGCDLAQGYFMSRPVPAADLDAWLSERAAVPAPRNPLELLDTVGAPEVLDNGAPRDLAS